MEQLRCPKCKSTNWRCWDERQLDWWLPDGSLAGFQVIGMLACNDCNHAWADVNPSDEDMRADGAEPNADQERWVYK